MDERVQALQMLDAASTVSRTRRRARAGGSASETAARAQSVAEVVRLARDTTECLEQVGTDREADVRRNAAAFSAEIARLEQALRAAAAKTVALRRDDAWSSEFSAHAAREEIRAADFAVRLRVRALEASVQEP